jgi:hypothetical protein
VEVVAVVVVVEADRTSVKIEEAVHEEAVVLLVEVAEVVFVVVVEEEGEEEEEVEVLKVEKLW